MLIIINISLSLTLLHLSGWILLSTGRQPTDHIHSHLSSIHFLHSVVFYYISHFSNTFCILYIYISSVYSFLFRRKKQEKRKGSILLRSASGGTFGKGNGDVSLDAWQQNGIYL